MTSVNGATVLPLKIWGGIYPQPCSTGCSVQGGPLTPFPHHHLAFSSRSSFSALFPCLGCKSLAAVWSLFSAMSVFCPRAYPDAHCPQRPVFLVYVSPPAATFIVFLVFFFAFAASQGNYFPLKFVKASQILSAKAILLKQFIHPKNSPGEATGLLPCLLPVQICLVPCIWKSWAQSWLCLLLSPPALPTGEHLNSCCLLWDGKEIVQQDSISQMYHFSCSHRRPAGITTPKLFSSRTWAVLLRTKTPGCQVSPLQRADRRALPLP